MFSARTIAQLVAEFGLGEPVGLSGPTARGEHGAVFRLTTTTGEWAVKQPFDEVHDGDLPEGVAFADAARAGGVPTPEVRRTRDGSLFAATDAGKLQVQGWVDLAPVSSELDPVAVGRVVAALHRTEFVGSAGEHWWYREPVGASRWAQLERDLTAAGAPFADDLAGLREELVALEELLEPAETLRTCHRDLFADNLRGTVTGGLCVIDWDNCGLADPAQELTMVIYDFGCGDPMRARELYRAYRAAGGPARINRPGQFTFPIAQLGHINERACARWLAAAPGDPERDRMAALFGEFVARPLNREFIEQTLDAL